MDDVGEDMQEHLMKKYGPAGVKNFGDPNSHLYQAGRQVGIEFTSKRKIYPTVMAHALVEHVKQTDNDKANKLMEEMYEEYFCQGSNINDLSVLTTIAARCGLDEQETAKACQDADLQLQVRKKDREYKTQSGVSGVPFYIIQPIKGGRPFGFSGAQPAEIIAEQLEMAAEE